MPRTQKAVCVDAYRQFIINAVESRGGVIAEAELDRLIEAKFREHWSSTDRRPWGNQRHPKWKQNVAPAKSALDRRGVIVRYVMRVQVGQTKRYRNVVYRVKLPRRVFTEAWRQWASRPSPDPKRRYEELPQPEAVFVVPEVE